MVKKYFVLRCDVINTVISNIGIAGGVIYNRQSVPWPM